MQRNFLPVSAVRFTGGVCSCADTFGQSRGPPGQSAAHGAAVGGPLGHACRVTPAAPERFHAFTSLVLTLSERSLDQVRTEHEFLFQATRTGAEVWRSSVIHGPGGSCSSGDRFVGTLNSRQVVDLLHEIERSGVYEALPLQCGEAGGDVVDTEFIVEPYVSMRVASASREHRLFDEQPASNAIVHDLSEAIRKRVELAMERALTCAG